MNTLPRVGQFVGVATTAVALVVAAATVSAQTPGQTPPTQTPSLPSQPQPPQPRPTPPAGTPQNPMAPPKPAGSGTGTTKSSPSASTANAASENFLKMVAQDGQAEIALADVANSQSQNADVKALADKIKSDHTEANEELQTLANAKQVMLPAEPTAAQKATKDRLARLSGAAFDRAYVSAMVKAHQTAVAEFTKQSKGSDPDVSAFADKMLPALRDHLQRAQAVQKQIGATGTSAKSKSSGGAAK